MPQRRKTAQVEGLLPADMSQPNATALSKRGAAAFAAALTLSAPGVAAAQSHHQTASPPPPPTPVRGLYSTSGASRYATPDGSVRFVFDRSFGRLALVRFEGDPEVHVLRPFMAAGGDELYRNDAGDVMLRVTRHGGIIVYTRAHETGSPASEEAQVAPLAPDAIAVAQMRQRLRELQEYAARQVGAPVQFDAPVQVNGPTAGVVLDAAERAAKGLADAPVTTVRRVVIIIGPAPGAMVQGEQLTIQITPQMGFAGRPSSNAIRNVVTGQRQGPEQ